MALIHAFGDNPLADARAKEASEYLAFSYPNHSWWVEVRQGVLIIKHLEASGARGLIGMMRHLDKLSADAKLRKQDIVRAAGELLERANLPRGARGEDPVTSFELDDRKLQKYWHTPHHHKVVH